MAKQADKYFETQPWQVIERGYDTNYAKVSESVFALSNETLGIRGSFDEGGNVESLRGAYINGVYEIDELPRSYKGIVDKTHFMVPAADWLYTQINIDGEILDLSKIKFSAFERVLDMQKGTLTRRFVWHTASGKDVQCNFTRFVDMNHGERAYQEIVLCAINGGAAANVTSGISFDTKHVGRDKCFWEVQQKDCAPNGSCEIIAVTQRSKQSVYAGALVQFNDGEKDCIDELCVLDSNDRIVARRVTMQLTKGKPASIIKRAVILYDHTEGGQLRANGAAKLQESANMPYEQALKAQENYWARHWQLNDVQITPAPAEADAVAEEQQGIRFCSFQMAQTYKGGNVRHNIGAKGLTGEAYNGHAFWDTEACCFPFYLFTNPEAAKSLLVFRFNTLPQALERAKMLDCEGACYPIATLNGEEACNLWQHASLQFQPSSAVSYGIWHYVTVTRDEEFLWQYGAEMLLQIARFMASRVGQNPHNGAYGYYGVMGPDEFHMMVNNNAYTNYMGKRALEYATDVLTRMESEHPTAYRGMAEKTALNPAELVRWRDIAEHMAIPATPEGLIEQHDGYFDLPYIDVNAIPIEEFPLYTHWSYDRIYRTSMIKQPDVLMFLYLYNSSFTPEEKRINYEYYEPRTIHESSLSPSVHSILAAELGRMDEATRFFGYATRLDLDNYNRNTCEGLHTTSIAMAWINIVYGFAGLRSDDAVLHFAPRMPDRWQELRFRLSWQGRVFSVEMKKDTTAFTLESGDAMPLIVYEKEEMLSPVAVLVIAQG
ncbi:MAG: family 65 glycosyl hydrolase [Defluviitaleaceae bacterium]|nr:family 65 glycosyl hydrolase [Defluviitaleaceae bacterium]MCL2274462.1 family 65 glycosyl hydrolase [Defluviitaleaceae bacterium]